MHVLPQAPGVFRVECESDGRTTRHEVTVPERVLDDIGLPRLDPIHLVEATVEYLLERDPTAVLHPTMDLGDLARFMPGYTAEIRDRLQVGGGG